MTLTPSSSRSGGSGDGGYTVVTKASDQSIDTQTTPQNDTELLFLTDADQFYYIELMLRYGSPAGAGTPDLKTVYGEDASARGQMFGNGISNTDTITTFSANADQSATIVLGTLAADRVAVIRGCYIGAGGTFRLKWAQNVSGGNPTIVRAGSTLRYVALG